MAPKPSRGRPAARERQEGPEADAPTVADILRYGLKEDLLIIDFHTHLGRSYHYWYPEQDSRELVARMDTFGIRTSVLHHTLGLVCGEFRRGNDIVGKAMLDYPGRLEAATVVNPNYASEMIPELQRCLDAYDMRVIKLYPSMHRCPLDSKLYWPVYDFAAEHRFIVVTHCGPKSEFGSAGQFAAMAARYPQVPFVPYHVGYDFEGAQIYGQFARENANYFVEICGPVTENSLEWLVRECGEDRVLFGSDTLFLALPPQIGRIASCHLTEEQKRKVLGLNAKRLLDGLGRTHGSEQARVQSTRS